MLNYQRVMIENVKLCIKLGGKPANFRGLNSKNSDFTTTSGECLTAADDEGDCSRLCDGVIDLYCLEQGRRLSENGTQDTGKHHSDHSLYVSFPCANIMPTHLMLLSAIGLAVAQEIPQLPLHLCGPKTDLQMPLLEVPRTFLVL